jgi:hypothetical protein
MKLTDDDLRTLWREHTANVPPDQPRCLTEADWARLLSKQMDAAERAQAAEHIASCSQCADEYRLLLPLQAWGEDMERVLSPGRVRSDSGWRAWWSSPRLALAVSAATVLLVTQGATLWQFGATARENAQLESQLEDQKAALSSAQNSVAALRQELQRTTEEQGELQERLAQFSAPQLDVAVVDLDPQPGEAVRGGSEPSVATIAPSAAAFTVILNFSPLPSPSSLEVEVSRGGQVRWTGRVQRDAGASTVTLALPSVDYPNGEYLIRLFDVTRARRALASYPLVIRHAALRSP